MALVRVNDVEERARERAAVAPPAVLERRRVLGVVDVHEEARVVVDEVRGRRVERLLLADAHVDAGDSDGRRLEAETVDTLRLIGKVRAAIRSGDLAVRDDTGRPSTEAIRRYFGCEKRRAQGVADALALLDVQNEAPSADAGLEQQ